MNIILYIILSFLLPGVGNGFFLYQPEIPDQMYMTQLKTSAANDTTPVPARDTTQNLPPHTARVKVEIINFDSDTKNLLLHLKVKEILGYGASAPVLSAGEVLTVNANTFFMTSNRQKDWIESGKTALAVINHTLAFEMNPSSSNWSIVELKEYKKTD